MNLTIISGSHRPDSQSLKISNYIQERLKKLNLFNEVKILDLSTLNLPFWDEGFWRKDEKWIKAWTPVENILKKTNALVIVAPEWGGMVTPMLKNFFLLCNPHLIGHKPALLVSVSASRGGSYPINELRTSSYKNTKICYIPEHIIVRNCKEVLNSQFQEIENESDGHIKKRLDFTLDVLHQYGLALSRLNINLDAYPYGM